MEYQKKVIDKIINFCRLVIYRKGIFDRQRMEMEHIAQYLFAFFAVRLFERNPYQTIRLFQTFEHFWLVSNRVGGNHSVGSKWNGSYLEPQHRVDSIVSLNK